MPANLILHPEPTFVVYSSISLDDKISNFFIIFEKGSKGCDDKYKPKAENSFSNFSENEKFLTLFNLTFKSFVSSFSNNIF